MALPKSARERVSDGARFFDGYDPDWYRKVDPDLLDVSSGRRCPWGQLKGHYDNRPLRLRLFAGRSYRLGFIPDDQFWVLDTDGLNEAWRNEIAVRRERDQALASAGI